jgi:hypothetical protein
MMIISSSKKSTLSLGIATGCLALSEAFVSSTVGSRPMTAIYERPQNANGCGENLVNNRATSRRNALMGLIGAIGAAGSVNPDPAFARYSAFTNRELDWKERQGRGPCYLQAEMSDWPLFFQT